VRAQVGATLAFTVTVFVATFTPPFRHEKVLVNVCVGLEIEKPLATQAQSSALALMEDAPMVMATANEINLSLFIRSPDLNDFSLTNS
jgi:hypothetical protein